MIFLSAQGPPDAVTDVRLETFAQKETPLLAKFILRFSNWRMSQSLFAKLCAFTLKKTSGLSVEYGGHSELNGFQEPLYKILCDHKNHPRSGCLMMACRSHLDPHPCSSTGNSRQTETAIEFLRITQVLTKDCSSKSETLFQSSAIRSD